MSDFWSFFKLQRVDLISWRNQFCTNVWIIWSSFCLSILSCKDPNSLSFITFQCFLHNFRILFSDFSNLHKLKRGDLFFILFYLFFFWGGRGEGEPVLLNSLIIWLSLLYFNLKIHKDRSVLSFIGFHFILYDSSVLFSDFSNFQKLRNRTLSM